MAKSIMEEIVRGFGLQTGRSLSRQTTKSIQKKFYNDSSKFRKIVDRFQLPGRVNQASGKLITLINAFREEYSGNEPMLQRNLYMAEDLKFIQEQIQFFEAMCVTEDEKIELARVNQMLAYSIKLIS